MGEKPGINSMVREILDRRLTVDRERNLFDLKMLGNGQTANSDNPKMKLVKDDAA
jgi:hypothetical protein